MNNADVFKTTVEDDLKIIAKSKLDILILQRQNETLCKTNNEEIEKLSSLIEGAELMLEQNLSNSGEKKIETPAGWCAYRVMPDRWEYDEPVILKWMKGTSQVFYHTVEILEKMKLKNAILSSELKLEEVPGVTITPQDPKFSYKLNGGL